MKSLLRPFIVDVEASGFGPDSYPVEIGLALESQDRYCSLIRPHAAWTHWDRKAQDLHGISRKTLEDHGKAPAEVAMDLNRLLEGKTVYTDGWVVDKPWISKLFNDSAIQKRFFVSPLERILSEPQMEIWHQTKEEVLLTFACKRHRASCDAWIVQETFLKTLKMTA